MSLSRLVLIRHGQTDWNLAHRYQGQSDIPLNDTGRAQARAAASVLKDFADFKAEQDGTFSWDAIVTSPLIRARETGEIIAQELGVALEETYEGMQERHFGSAEGQLATKENWENLETLFIDLEPLDAMTNRGLEALRQLVENRKDQNIIVVAHGLWISKIMTTLTGVEHAIPENASVTELDLSLLA